MIKVIRRWLWRLRSFSLLTPAATTIAAACFFVFWIQTVTASLPFAYGYSLGTAVETCFALNWDLFVRGCYWQPLTYMFLHGGWGHLFLNVLAIILFGAGVERCVGSRRFWLIFLLGGILGGLGWLAVMACIPLLPSVPSLLSALPESVRVWLPVQGKAQSLHVAACVGASGGVFALIGAFAALFPRAQVYVLLFFVLPLRLKARNLAILLGILTVLDAVFLQFQVAYAAHLAGGLAGYLIGVRLRGRMWVQEDPFLRGEEP